MEDFYKKLRDNLNERTEPTPEKRHWERMNELLDEKEKTPIGGYWQWVAAAMILLLLGTNLWWWQQERIHQEVVTITTVDTVFQTQIIVQTDTIYKEKIIIQNTNNQTLTNNTVPLEFYKEILNRPQLANLKQAFNVPTTNSIAHTAYTNSSLFSPNTTSTSNDLINKNTPSTTFANLTYLVKTPIAQVVYSGIEKLPEIAVESPITPIKKDLGTYLYAARPKALLVGVYGGWSKPFNDKINNQSGQVLGVELQTKLSDNLRLWASFDYTNNHYDTRLLNADSGVPPIDPPSDNYEFEKAKVRQSLHQYGVGLQYNFRTSKKLQPLIGFGYGVLQNRDYEVIYEFEDEITELELEIEQDIKGGDLSRNYLLLRGGVSYMLSDHWQLQFMANYRQQMSEATTPFAHLLELKGGVFYQF